MDEDAWSLISSPVASTRGTPGSEHSGFIFVTAPEGPSTEVEIAGSSRIAAADLPLRLNVSDFFLGTPPSTLSALANCLNDDGCYDFDDDGESDPDSLQLPPTSSTNPAVAAHLDLDTAASCWDDLLVQTGREMSRKMRKTTGKTHVAVSRRPGGQWLIREMMCDVVDDPRPRSRRWVAWWAEMRWYWPLHRYVDYVCWESGDGPPCGPGWVGEHKRFRGVLINALKCEFLKDDEDEDEDKDDGDLYSRLITSLRFLDLDPVPDRELISAAEAVAWTINHPRSPKWHWRPPIRPRDDTLVMMALAAESMALHAVHDDPPLAGAYKPFSRAVAMRRHPAPAAPYHHGDLVETRLARLALAAIGPERAVAAVNYLRTEEGMEKNRVARHAAIEILHPDGAAARHADLLPGLEDIECPCGWCSPPPKPVNPYWKKTRRAPGRGKLGGDTL